MAEKQVREEMAYIFTDDIKLRMFIIKYKSYDNFSIRKNV